MFYDELFKDHNVKGSDFPFNRAQLRTLWALYDTIRTESGLRSIQFNTLAIKYPPQDTCVEYQKYPRYFLLVKVNGRKRVYLWDHTSWTLSEIENPSKKELDD